MIIPGQVLAKAEKLNAENVSFVGSKELTADAHNHTV